MVSGVQPTVLLVEDDPDLNEVFTLLLEAGGHRVVRAYNGQEALSILATMLVDVILLDLLMPIMDGKTFLRHFQNAQRIPVVVFSNLDLPTEVAEVMRLGATRYILKAWTSPNDLSRVIQDVLAPH